MTARAQEQVSTRWQRWLLPGGLRHEADGTRSPRDWIVDVALFAIAILLGALLLADRWSEHGPLTAIVDIGCGALACIALWARRRIAREMHDVLAHRVSLLSLHAGALEFRPDAPPEEIAEAAGVIRRGEADDGRAVLGALDVHRPDVVVMDIRMPQVDGIAATRLLRSQPDPPQVILLTTFDADELVLRALQAGAAGFLLKDTPPAEIVRAIELVHAGEGMLSPAVTRRPTALVAGDSGSAARHEDARERLESLSGREREVALAIGRGCANAEIAAELHMSVATVKAHVSRILDKLGVENRVQIALLVQDATVVRR